MAEGQHLYGQPGPDRAVGRGGPAPRMSGGTEPTAQRPRPSVLIPPVASPLAPEPATAPRPSPPPPLQQPGGAEPTGRRASQASQASANQRGSTAAAQLARSAVSRPVGSRSARLLVTHIDPWSVMKQSFLLSLALAVILLVAAAALWFALDSAGVLDAITRTATEVGGESGSSLGGFLELGRVMGAALVLAGIETVLVTALSTLFAFMYNLAVGIGGGLEVTLSEDL